MKIKEVMKQTGLPERTIRYYEERGLIQPETYRNNGRTNHDYSASDIQKLQQIIIYRSAQFSIDEIYSVQHDPKSIPAVLAAHHERIVKTKAELADLSTLSRFSDKSDWTELATCIQSCLGSSNTLLSSLIDTDNAETDAELSAISAAHDMVVEQNKARWNTSSDAYSAFNQSDRFMIPILENPAKAFHRNVYEEIRRYFPDLTGVNICVPSSGDNHAVLAFAMLGATVTSCDLSEKQLGHAKMMADQFSWGKSINFVCTDTMTLEGVASDSFDFVFTSNGVHVWIPDLNAMYRSIRRVLKPNGLYMMHELHPFLRPFDRKGNVVKPYDMVGPFNDDDGITFAWRVMDFTNAISQAGLCIEHMNELYAEKDYDWPFWLSYDEIEKGATATPAEFDYMFDWRNNPMVALPNWINIVARCPQLLANHEEKNLRG